MKRGKIEKIASNSLFMLINNFNIKVIEDELIASNNITRKIFFDTSEVVGMIIGVNAFDTGMTISKELFMRGATLVHSLAYEGWLGEISLLPPHQDELYYKMTTDNNRFRKRRNRDEERKILNELLYVAGIMEVEKRLKKLKTKAMRQR